MALRLLTTALCLAGPGHVAALASALLGVEPGNEATYQGGEFRCLDGSGGALPANVINDEACDCADGSDEPGTGACAGQDSTLFFCKNEGSIPRRLYASRVGDGVCDCCDGSDEASLASMRPSAKCADKCAQEGASEAGKRQEKVDMLKRALKKQEEIRQKGLQTRDTLMADKERLNGELAPLELDFEAAKELAEVERKADADRKAAEEAAKPNVESKGPQCMWRQTTECEPDGGREAHHDKHCSEAVAKGNSGFCDCNGNDKKDEDEQGFTCELEGESSSMRYCNEICPKAEAASDDKPAEDAEDSATKEEEAAPAKEEKVVSEYTKWMEGADTAGQEDEKETIEDEATKDAKAAAALGDTDDEDDEDHVADKKEAPVEAAHAEAEKEPEAPKEETAVEKEDKAQTKVTEHKEKIQEVQDSLDGLTAERLGYATLHNNKLTRRVSEFNYDIEFFKSANQDSVSLGTWSKWTGPHSAEFTEGTMCWGGPARKLVVNFVCGETEQILDCFEPSRCVYQATVEHPGACEHAELEILETGKQVVGPKDEL